MRCARAAETNLSHRWQVGRSLPGRRVRTASHLVLLALLAGLCSACGPTKKALDPTLEELVSDELWKASNHGRVPLRGDGLLDLPPRVRRVVVDVGAHKLETTWKYLTRETDVAIIAIEPMPEPWASWPDDRRVIGLPAAISLERGMLDFNVNEKDVTSSLLDTTEESLLSTKTVEVRQVPGLRLEDVLERIPEDLPIVFLKTDVQGMDLAVLMSAGEHLHRVKEVRAEIIHDPSYEKKGRGSMAHEDEFHAYMRSMGFSVQKTLAPPGRIVVEAFYENDDWDG